MFAAGWIFENVGDQLKAILLKQSCIFLGIEAAVVERLAFELAQYRTVLRAAGEHQRRSFAGVTRENTEHLLLIFGTQMEKAVPRNDSVELAAQIEGTHVGKDPFLGGEALAAEIEQGLRGVNASDGAALEDEVLRDGEAGATAKVEDSPVWRNQGEEAVLPGLRNRSHTAAWR
jgi:hypothetical protein